MIDLDKLRREGYARVSNKYGHVSRIDRPDWREHMAVGNTAWLEALGNRAADHYRRCFSKDVLQVNPRIAQKLPPSGSGPTEYQPRDSEAKK